MVLTVISSFFSVQGIPWGSSIYSSTCQEPDSQSFLTAVSPPSIHKEHQQIKEAQASHFPSDS